MDPFQETSPKKPLTQPWKAFIKAPVLQQGQYFKEAADDQTNPIRLIVTCSAKTDLGG